MSQKWTLTPVELELMDILWNIHAGSVRDVMEHLAPERDLAYTSVSTILRILEQKQLVSSQKNGRQHIYKPILSKQKYATYSVKNMVENVFSGNSVELVAHLVNQQKLSRDEIAELQKLLEEKKKELK